MIPATNSRLLKTIGNSEPSRRVARLVQQLGASQVPVLLYGETGVGKEVAARAIHNVRKQGSFVTIDCGALPTTLIESELFGYVRGAFTGALNARMGLLQKADGGTAFFDEIGELPLEAQVKLLRVLQQREVRPIGSNVSAPCTFRVIAATNKDLKEEVRCGRFRLDLYYRLDVVTLELPPLRERKDDIPPLIDHFLALNETTKKPLPGLIETILNHSWPGNIRELENCIARLVALSSDDWLHPHDLPFGNGKRPLWYPKDDHSYLGSAIPPPRPIGHAPILMAEAERAAIERAMTAAGGRPTLAAKSLGIGRTTLYRKLRGYRAS